MIHGQRQEVVNEVGIRKNAFERTWGIFPKGWQEESLVSEFVAIDFPTRVKGVNKWPGWGLTDWNEICRSEFVVQDLKVVPPFATNSLKIYVPVAQLGNKTCHPWVPSRKTHFCSSENLVGRSPKPE